MNPAKIQFSEEESALLQNADWLLTKNRIISLIYSLMGNWSQQLQEQEELLKRSLPEEVFINGPKISKGESYLGLPYVVLDQPRSFSKENIFALRTFFWWGRSWTITLHLKGSYLNWMEGFTEEDLMTMAGSGFRLGYEGDEWDHNWTQNASIHCNTLTKKELSQLVQTAPFIKIGKSIPLSNWENWASEIQAIQHRLLRIRNY